MACGPLPPGALGAILEACGELLGSSGAVLGQSLGALGEDFGALGDDDDIRALILSLLRVLWKPASNSVLVVLWTFWLTSFAKFAKWQGSLPTRKYQ